MIKKLDLWKDELNEEEDVVFDEMLDGGLEWSDTSYTLNNIRRDRFKVIEIVDYRFPGNKGSRYCQGWRIFIAQQEKGGPTYIYRAKV